MLKIAAYRSGMLSLIHRRRNRDTLTVAMFHRVLPESSSEYRSADSLYTVSDQLFRACLDFFKRHYNVVDLPAVLAARAGGAPLPPRALLITFDDGWADNQRYAQPLLQAAGLPAVIFVVADVIEDAAPLWWQEQVFRATRTGQLAAEKLSRIITAAGSPSGETGEDSDPVLTAIARLAALGEPRRHKLLTELVPDSIGSERQMLAASDLPALAVGNMTIGAHGATHAPLTLVPKTGLDRELRQARERLGDASRQPVASLSFPHGRYSASIIAMARGAGYRAQFTSDYYLSPAPKGRLTSDIHGRVLVPAPAITDQNGQLRPELLALWLIFRPVRTPSG